MKIHMLVVALLCLLSACASQNRPLQLVGGAGPIYPEQAQAHGIEGVVEVRYDVSVDGFVENAVVVSSEPEHIFDQAALAAVRSWRFNAPMVDGQRRAALARVSNVQFKLSSDREY